MLPIILALIACDLRFDPTGSDTAAPDDLDADGATVEIDCDDADRWTHPDAAETCDGRDNDCDGEIDEGVGATFYVDADGDGFGDAAEALIACAAPDGFVSNDGDCDDTDTAIHPGAVEICEPFGEARDNDCDGLADDETAIGVETWYVDRDDDGYGADVSAVTSCEAPTGYVSAGGDCDDDVAGVNPGAWEHCDGRDMDCDGVVDGANAIDALIWYRDADSDGFGDVDQRTPSCSGLVGHVADSTDCDDTDDTRYPGATEFCNQEDDDCDGAIDEAGTVDAVDWYTDADGDGYGTQPALGRSCDGAIGQASNQEDCDDTDATVNPAAVEVWYDGVDSDCDRWSDYDADGDQINSAEYGGGDCDDSSSDVKPGSTEIWYDGVDSDCGGDNDFDADGDGFEGDGGADCDDADSRTNPDAFDLCANDADDDCDGVVDDCIWSSDMPVFAAADLRFYSSSYTRDPQFGAKVTGAGDLDGDGLDDIAIGEPWIDDYTGTVNVYLSSGALSSPSLSTWEADAGSSMDDGWGSSVTDIGDFNGDGYDDLIDGDPNVSDSGGAAVVLLGPVSGGGFSGSVALVGGDGSVGDGNGKAVSGAGDVDGDGLADVVVAADRLDAGGAGAYVVLGAATGAIAANILGTVDALSDVGDVDGDGLDDVLVGGDGGYLFRGPLSGSISLNDADTIWFSGGDAISGAGDVDGDGLPDVLISDTGDSTGAPTGGAVYIASATISGMFSLDDARVKLYGESGNGGAGSAVSDAGDTDGDGRADVLVGAPGANTAYLVLGGGALGPLSGSLSLAGADVIMTADSVTEDHPDGVGLLYYADAVGASVSGAGDVDGDGLDDILIGGEGTISWFPDSDDPYGVLVDYREDSGAAWLFLGR